MKKDSSSGVLSARLGALTDELRTLDLELKLGQPPDALRLQEFREMMDKVRMTAWTAGELLNAREAQKDPGTALSFLTSERLRRFGQLVQDLNADIEEQGTEWQTHGIQGLYQYVSLLQERLGRLMDQHRAHVEEVSDAGPIGRA